MDKQEFFNKLRVDLGNKYKIPDEDIATIRSFALGSGMDRLEIMDWADNKLREYKQKHLTPKIKWQRLFNFLENLSDEAWEDITQKTVFDK